MDRSNYQHKNAGRQMDAEYSDHLPKRLHVLIVWHSGCCRCWARSNARARIRLHPQHADHSKPSARCSSWLMNAGRSRRPCTPPLGGSARPDPHPKMRTAFRWPHFRPDSFLTKTPHLKADSPAQTFSYTRRARKSIAEFPPWCALLSVPSALFPDAGRGKRRKKTA